MKSVKIIGGGLTGILAAFEAHRMGAREISIHERFDRLGGVSLSDERNGLEIREGCIYFGGADDPLRQLLESHGQRFVEFDNRFGSVSPGDDGPVYTEDFGGPALPADSFQVTPPAGDSLADRIAAYPSEIAWPLMRYARWHLGFDLEEAHCDAAIPMAINRVVPLGVDFSALAEAKRTDPLTNELLAIPRKQWGRTANLVCSLPEGGFPAMLRNCERSLAALGVSIHCESLIPPRQALAAMSDDEVIVWAANPTPLFKAMGVPTPKLLPKSFATYTFAARWTGACPFYVQNFTAEGACFRVYVYESAGQTLITAECVAEASDAELRAEISRLLAGFEGELQLGQMLATSIKPRWIYHSIDAIQRLTQLRAALADRFGSTFVPAAWEPYAKAEKFALVNARLAAALGLATEQVAAA